MLDNLVNANLPGLVGNIQYSTSDLMIPQIIGACAGLFLVLALVCIIMGLFSTRKTKMYRETLVDMYIAGTVRKLAKDEGINLDEEYKTFVKETKKTHLHEKSLDDVIETEKAEKYIEEQEKKTKKLKE